MVSGLFCLVTNVQIAPKNSLQERKRERRETPMPWQQHPHSGDLQQSSLSAVKSDGFSLTPAFTGAPHFFTNFLRAALGLARFLPPPLCPSLIRRLAARL